MSTRKENVQLFERVNSWLRSVGPDGKHVKQRLFERLGIQPGPTGDYSRVGLTDQQRQQFQQLVEAELGFRFPSGIEIDPAGNMNENEGAGKWAKDWRTYAAIGAGVTGLGALGIGPLAGVLGGGASGAASGGAVNAAGIYTTPAFAGAMAPVAPGAMAGGLAGAAGTVAGALRPTSEIVREVLASAGAGLGSAADAAAYNRGTQFDADVARAALQQQAERDYQNASLAREQSGRANRRDAWDLMNRANYVANAPDDLNTTKLSPYSRSIAGPTADQRTAATSVRDDANRRLADPYSNLPIPERVGTDVDLADPSGWETAAGIGSAAAGIASHIPTDWWRRLGRWIP